MNTLVITPASYLFSPFVPHGNLYSLIIAIVLDFGHRGTLLPDRWIRNRTGLVIAGIVGSMTNTIFVLSGIYFSLEIVRWDSTFQPFDCVSTNPLIEVIVTVLITSSRSIS